MFLVGAHRTKPLRKTYHWERLCDESLATACRSGAPPKVTFLCSYRRFHRHRDADSCQAWPEISPRFLLRLPQLLHIFSANLFQCHIGRSRTNFVILHKRWFLLHILAASWPWRVVLIATYCNPSMTKFVSSNWTNSFSKSPSFALNIPLPSTTSLEVESETRKCKN